MYQVQVHQKLESDSSPTLVQVRGHEAYLWKVDADGVVMPFSVTDLCQFPAPLGRLECVQVDTVARLLSQEHHEPTVVNKHGKVMPVHA